MRTIIVEGWRFIPHSYALVSQYLCLEFLERAGLRVLHRDLPYFYGWWRAAGGLWPPQLEAKLQALVTARPDEEADAVLRIGAPYSFHNDPLAKRTLVFATTEYKFLRDSSIAGAVPARQALSAAEATIMTCSGWAAEGLIQSGAQARNVVVVPHGADTRTFAPASARTRASLREEFGWEDKYVIINLSAMTFNKGIGLLLKAFAAIADRFPQARVVLKGADELYPSHDYVVSALAELSPEEAAKVRPRVLYTGATLSSEGIAQLMQAADLYVSPYRAEGFNLPVLEAAACGIPVICTRGGPTDDFISDEFALRIDSELEPGPDGGIMLSPDLAHLTELVTQAISDPEFRHRAAAAGPRWVSERYTWRHAADQVLSLLFPTLPQSGSG